MDWSNGKVGIIVSPETGRRTFYLLRSSQQKGERRGGGGSERRRGGMEKKRSTRNEIKQRYPTMRLPSAASILTRQERKAGRKIKLKVQNDSNKPIYVHFYTRVNFLSPTVEKQGDFHEIPKDAEKPITGPTWTLGSRQYLVAGFNNNDSEFPESVNIRFFGKRISAVGWNLRESTYNVSGNVLHTLQVT